jgi:predicted membrane-bound mannosyltransferase
LKITQSLLFQKPIEKWTSSMNEGRRLLVYFVCHIEVSRTTTPLVMLAGMVGKSSMSKGCTELVSLCFKLSWRSYWTLNSFFYPSTENSFKAKLEITWEFVCTLDIVGNPSFIE